MDNLVLVAPGGGTIKTIPVTVNTSFFGFVTSPTKAVSEIIFESQINNPDPTVGQGFGLENVVGAYNAPAVPEPTSLLLLGTVVVAAMYCRRKTGHTKGS